MLAAPPIPTCSAPSLPDGPCPVCPRLAQEFEPWRQAGYGSGAVWAGQLAAIRFPLLQTLCLWRLNPRAWLTADLTACAESGGAAPAEVERFLPWNLKDEERRRWSLVGTEAEENTS